MELLCVMCFSSAQTPHLRKLTLSFLTPYKLCAVPRDDLKRVPSSTDKDPSPREWNSSNLELKGSRLLSSKVGPVALRGWDDEDLRIPEFAAPQTHGLSSLPSEPIPTKTNSEHVQILKDGFPVWTVSTTEYCQKNHCNICQRNQPTTSQQTRQPASVIRDRKNVPAKPSYNKLHPRDKRQAGQGASKTAAVISYPSLHTQRCQ